MSDGLSDASPLAFDSDNTHYEIVGNNPPVSIEDEIPFEIPESWTWVRLGDIGNWQSGSAPPRNNTEYYGGGIPWLKTGDLNDGYINFTSETITEKALKERKLRLNPIGSILIAMYGATIGKLGILNIASTTNQACCACLPILISNRYLFYFLMSQKKRFTKQAEGGAQPNISKEKIVATLFPLPPLAEQKRIVAKIEELQPFIDEYDQKENELTRLNADFPEALKKSILQEAVMGKLVPQDPDDEPASVLLERIRAEKERLIAEGKIKRDKNESRIYKRGNSYYELRGKNEVCIDDEIPFEIPESWEWVRLPVIASLCLGKMLDKQKNKGIFAPYLRNTNVKWGTFDLSDLLEMKFEDVENDRFLIKKGDLVVCEGGEPGRCAIWDEEYPIHFQKALHRIRFYDDIEVSFFMFLIKYYAISGSLNELFTGTTIKHLTGQSLEKVLVPLPPRIEQKKIVSAVEILFKRVLMV